MSGITKIVEKNLAPLCEGEYVKRGAQGRTRETSFGLMLGTPHLTGAKGQEHLHNHVFAPNASFTPDGGSGAVGDANKFFRDAAAANARIQKELSDIFRGWEVETQLSPDGRHVRASGIPEPLIKEASGGRRSRRSSKKRAAPATRAPWPGRPHRPRGGQAGGPQVSLAERHLATTLAFEQHGVDPRRPSCRTTGSSAPSSTAKRCSGTRSGKASETRPPRPRNSPGSRAATPRRNTPGTPAGAASGGSRPVRRPAAIPERRPGNCRTRARAGEPDLGRFWKQFAERMADLGDAGKVLGKAVVFATVRTAAEVLRAAAEYFTPPPPAKLVIDATGIREFIDTHAKASRLRAHGKALKDAFRWDGRGFGERVLSAEITYWRARHPRRIEKGTVIVVERGLLADARDLRELAKLAGRDKCFVVLSDRPPPALPQRHEFRGPGRADGGGR